MVYSKEYSLQLPKTFIGFTDLVDQVNSHFNWNKVEDKYPPYNIIKNSDREYSIEIALSGFKKEDVDIVFEDQTLKISGKSGKENYNIEGVEETYPFYLYKGIGTRSFTREFKLNKNVEVDSANFSDGILTVYISDNTPEKTIKKIDIK